MKAYSIGPFSVTAKVVSDSFGHTYSFSDYSIPPSNISFYFSNYQAIAGHNQQTGCKHFLGSRDKRRCRFCGRSALEGAQFKQDAHAFPWLVGNTTLFTYYECDTCNERFGNGIEDHLGKFLKPYRLLAAIKGRRGFPEIKSETGGWRVFRDNNVLNVHHHSDKRIFHISDDRKILTMSLPREPYCPQSVYKAFTKMALSLMPEDEMDNCGSALGWIADPPTVDFAPPTMSTTFVEGPPVNALSALLLKRKNDATEAPYYLACFLIGNMQFQLMLPCIEKDSHLMNKTMTFPVFPISTNIKKNVFFEQIDLTNPNIVRNEEVKYEFSYEEKRLVETLD